MCVCVYKVQHFAEPCVWNDWELGECSATCGGGTRDDARTKKTEAKYGGSCSKVCERTKPCNTDKCPRKCIIKIKFVNLLQIK